MVAVEPDKLLFRQKFWFNRLAIKRRKRNRLKAIHLTAPPDVSVGYAVSKHGLAIQVKMTNTSTGEVVRSFNIKAADLTKAMKSNIVLKGSQIDARS